MPASAEAMYEAANLHAGPGKSLSELVRWVEHVSGVEIMPGGEGSTATPARDSSSQPPSGRR